MEVDLRNHLFAPGLSSGWRGANGIPVAGLVVNMPGTKDQGSHVDASLQYYTGLFDDGLCGIIIIRGSAVLWGTLWYYSIICYKGL